MLASAVSAPTRVARTTSRPSTLIVEPTTSSPGPTSTGTLSPVISDASIDDAPSSTTPSVATFSPGRTTKRSPTTSAAPDGACSRPSASSTRGVRGAEVGEGAQRPAGTALGPGLEVPTAEDQGDGGGRDLEVDVVLLAAGRHERHHHRHPAVAGGGEQQGAEAGAERGDHAERDERVHRRRAVAGVQPRRPVERPCRPDGHGRGEQQGRSTASCGTAARRPSRARAPGRRAAPRRRSAGVGRATPGRPRRHRSIVGRGMRRARLGGARQLPRRSRSTRRSRTQPIGRGQRRVVAHGGLLGGVVHRGGHPVEPVELLLDARRARGAGHPGDRAGRAPVQPGNDQSWSARASPSRHDHRVGHGDERRRRGTNCRNARYVPAGSVPVNVNTLAARPTRTSASSSPASRASTCPPGAGGCRPGRPGGRQDQVGRGTEVRAEPGGRCTVGVGDRERQPVAPHDEAVDGRGVVGCGQRDGGRRAPRRRRSSTAPRWSPRPAATGRTRGAMGRRAR